MPVLIVHRAFRAKRDRTYSPGRFRVSADEVAELEDWRATMEAQASEREWDGVTTSGQIDLVPILHDPTGVEQLGIDQPPSLLLRGVRPVVPGAGRS